MKEDTKIYLTGLAYELGDFHAIEDIDELREKPQVLETLLTLGLETYTKSNLTTLEMAKKSALCTLERAKISPKDIDVLIYATYNLWDLELPGYLEIGRLINDLDLENAYPIGTFLSGCGNLHTAFRIGTNLIKSGNCKNVLVITTDRFPEIKSRIAQPGPYVLSDAAASCLLTISEVKGEFEVLCTSQIIDSEISYLDGEKQYLEMFEKIMNGLKKVCNNALETMEKETHDFCKLITNNYNISVTKSFCDSMNFDIEQAYMKNISRIAHASSADNIINLYDFSLENSLLTNDLILLVGTGPNTWGCTVLSKRRGSSEAITRGKIA